MGSRISISIFNRDGLKVAGVAGPVEQARREASHYAMMYADEGPLKIKERRLKAMTKDQTPAEALPSQGEQG